MYGYIAILRAHHIPPDLECPGLEPEKCIFWRFISNFDVSVLFLSYIEILCVSLVVIFLLLFPSLPPQLTQKTDMAS